jgi:hypothetical protein
VAVSRALFHLDDARAGVVSTLLLPPVSARSAGISDVETNK